MSELAIADVVTLKDNDKFRGKVLAIELWGDVHLEVVAWAGEYASGYRGKDWILSKVRCPRSRLVKVEKEKDNGL